jgi:uncharacterized repeat protein (TIGR01451 family)/LPXTG-motif cell wall-anchored protein
MDRLFIRKVSRMLRDNRRRRDWRGIAAVAGAVVAVVCGVLLMYPAHALTGGDSIRNAITVQSTVFSKAAGTGDDAWQATDPATPVGADSSLRLRLAFKLPAGTLANGSVLQYQLPDGVNIDTSKAPVSGDVISGVTVADPTNANATKIGSYQIKDGVLTLTFNDDVTKANAGSPAGDASDSAAAEQAQAGSDLSGYVDIDLGFDQLTCDDSGLATIKLNDAVTLRVTKAAEEKDQNAVADATADGAGETDDSASQDADSQADATSAASPVARVAARAGSDSVDLTNYITSVSVQKQNDDKLWGDATTEFTNGDYVKTTIYFSVPISTDNHKYSYKVPTGLNPKDVKGGNLTTPDGKNVGTWTWNSNDGTINLDFNKTAIAEGGTYSGGVWFQGIVSNDGGGESTEINFGGNAGTITVKKGESGGGDDDKAHDIKVEKTATKSADDSKIYYTVTVSTEKGTPSTVDISDCLSKWKTSNATPAYETDGLVLKKVSSNGAEQLLGNSATWNINGNDGPTFSLTGLPQLSAGEKYVLTYTVDTKRTSVETDAQVSNRASATSGSKSGDADQTVRFEQDAKKWGSYDPKTDHVIWTIEVNPNGKDISNWKVSDSLPKGTKLTQQYVVRSADGLVNQTFGNVGDSTVDFEFSKLGSLTDLQKTQKYYIDIYTDAPSSDGQVSNTATTTTNTGTVDSTGTADVKHRTTEVSKQHKTDAAADEKGTGVRKETWSPTVTLPGGALSSFTYTDTIADATNGNGVGLGADSHYAIAAELDKVFRSSAQNTGVDATTGLFINVDGYSRYLYQGNGKTYYDDYWPQQDGTKHDVSFTVTYYDAKGNEVAVADTTTHVKSFAVHVDVANGATVKALDMRTGEYPTYVDTTKVDEGGTISASNEGKVGDATSTPSFTYTRPHRMLKAVKTGDHAYKDGKASLDFDKIQDGKLAYRIALTTDSSDDGKDIVVTDTLPSGMTYVDGSLKAAFFQDEWNSYSTNDAGTNLAAGGANAPKLETGTTEDGKTQLKVTIPNYRYSANRPTVAVSYDVSISSDPSWNNGSTKKTYENTATWGKSTSTQKTEVNRNYEKVSKSGEQLYDTNGEPTNNLRYYVEINAAGQDLDPNSDVLTLTDKFDSGSVDSDLDPSSIKLYAYDYSKEHHYDPDRPIENFKATYDAKTHTITVEVPDKRACVLTYEYTLDNSFGDGMKVTNNASLNGKYSKSGSISLKEASGGAFIHMGRLVLYKVDAADISKTLAGVEFELSYWNGSTWVDKQTAHQLVTDAQGSITYDYELNEDSLQPNTLYRLTETKGQAGYATDAEHFFIVKNVPTTGSPISDDAAFSAANAGNATNKSGGTLTASDVDFFKNNKTSTMYVTNEYIRLTAKKAWSDESGVAKDAPAGSSAKLALYRYTKKVDSDNSVNVTVTAKGNQSWSNETRLSGDRVSNGTVAIKKGSDFSFNVGGLWDRCSFDVYVNGQKYGDTHTFTSGSPVSVNVSNVTADITIEVKQNLGNDVTLTEDPNNPWTEPPQILDDATGVQVGDPVDVSASDNWTYNWDDLPKQVDGKDVYYAVKELSYTVNGTTYDAGTGSYDVSYTNNTGIQTGTITVTNSAKKNQGYELPSTGGTPSSLPAVGGAIALGACALLALRWRRRNG